MLGAMIALTLVQGAPTDVSTIPGAYKSDGNWAYFRNEDHCTASAQQLGGDQILSLLLFDDRSSLALAFTRPAAPDLKSGDQRRLDIRFHRSQGVLDEGWEDVTFTVLDFAAGMSLMVGQPMAYPGWKDVSEMQEVEFIDRGRKAGQFRMRQPKRAIAELKDCIKTISSR